ncbi:MAG: tRNA (adenosine(37)-N6)-threonylcarbamoyltransferase complex ATPase subunit type 1 TsaE, partial [Nitrospiria bacterium]
MSDDRIKPGLTEEEAVFTLICRGHEETFRLGGAFGVTAAGGEVIALIGPLGAGKTLFVQGLAEGLEVTGSCVRSPTFTLIHQHEGRLPLYHIDLYRLD